MSYQGFSTLYNRFRALPFQIFMFPCNQFGYQEPNSNQWIEKFVRGNGTHKCGLLYCDWTGYVPYPLFAKANVESSWCTADPKTACTATSSTCCSTNDKLWQWIETLHPGEVPKWNFAGKNLFDRCGNLAYHYNDETMDPALLSANITTLLGKKC